MNSIRPYVGRTLRIFISYSSNDKELAGKLKSRLDGCGFETFLAHEDLEFGSEWEEHIIQELKSSDIFLPLLSSHFKDSDWASQETGIAFQLGKKILPLKIDLDPYGFIRGIHATRLNESNIYDVCIEIIRHLKNEEDRRYSEGIKDTLIRGFVDSWSFDNANAKAGLLDEFNDFTADQVGEIVRGAIMNSQIRGGFASAPFVRRCIEKYKDRLNKEIVAQAMELLSE